jgi:tungstate transport system substrate-binding protein
MRLYVVGLLCVAALACEGREARPLRLATTTSVDHSGLLGAVLPAFTDETGLRVDVLAVGTGRALALLARGDADLALTHDPEAEQVFVDGHPGARVVPVMRNDFLLVGPPADPAGVRGSGSAPEAILRMAERDAWFVSRGDSSGTDARAHTLWRAAGRYPEATRLIETGQGMSPTLRIASEREAYTLSDRATFLQLAPTLSLAVLLEGGDDLVNTYALVTRDGGVRAADAEQLREWFLGDRGREAIAAFRVAGRQVFAPVVP